MPWTFPLLRTVPAFCLFYKKIPAQRLTNTYFPAIILLVRYGWLAQLVRALRSHRRGRGFESPILHQNKHRRFVRIYGVFFCRYTLSYPLYFPAKQPYSPPPKKARTVRYNNGKTLFRPIPLLFPHSIECYKFLTFLLTPKLSCDIFIT